MSSAKPDFEIIAGDALTELVKFDDQSVQLFLTSPPYNIKKTYEKEGFNSLDEYAVWMRRLLVVMRDKLSDNGSICWQVGNYVKSGSVVPLDYIFYPIFSELGFKLRNRIIWTFNFGLHARSRLSGRYEVLLWLTKTDDYTFNLDNIRVPQIYPGKKHSSKKSKTGPSGNPLGKNPSDFWKFDGQAFFKTESVWEIPNVKSNHPEKVDHPCQFPSELAERCVLAFSDPSDLIVDPFSGTGTVPIAAEALGRRGVGIELQPGYAEMSRRRADDLRNGIASTRTSGMHVRGPKPSECVSQVPEEWRERASQEGI